MSGVKRFGAAALGAALVVATGGAWQDPGTAETAGERLEQAAGGVVKGLGQGVERARTAVRESYEQARERINDLGIEARVYGRIHWDKMLESSTIDIAAEGEGVVTLRGSISSKEARKRAIDLTAETIGVTRVLDELVIQASSPSILPAPASVARPAPEP